MTQACSSLGVILERVESRLLHHLSTAGTGPPDVRPTLKFFIYAFDWVEAKSSGRIISHKGADVDYDSARTSATEAETVLREHLKEQSKFLGDASIVSIGKDSYLLEVPDCLRGRVPRDYELRSSKKVGVKNYQVILIIYVLKLLVKKKEVPLIGQYLLHDDVVMAKLTFYINVYMYRNVLSSRVGSVFCYSLV